MAELRVKGTGTIKLFENDNTSNVTIASPASLGADRTITLPDASVTLASGTMLATDGDGSSLTGLTAGQIPGFRNGIFKHSIIRRSNLQDRARWANSCYSFWNF